MPPNSRIASLLDKLSGWGALIHDREGMMAMGFEMERFSVELVQSMSDAVVYADAQGVIQFWNSGATRIFGIAAADAVGQSLDIIIPAKLRQRHWDGYNKTMATGESRYEAGALLSVPAIRQDGSRISVEFTIVPFRDDAGQMAGIAAVMRDVTKQFEDMRALRKQLAARMLASTATSP